MKRESIQHMKTWTISNTPIVATSFGQEVLNREPSAAIDASEVVFDSNAYDDTFEDDEISFDYKNASHHSYNHAICENL